MNFLLFRKLPFVCLLFVSSAVGVFSAVSGSHAADQPNVILVITDDQGYGDVGFHGNSMIQTPNLDGLAKQSLRLTNFHVEPTCAETRAALMSGQFPLRVGVWHTIMGRSIMSADAKTMPQLFSESGYRTGMFGKWHLGDNYPYRPQDRGFDVTLHHGGGGVGQTPDVWGNDYFDDVYLNESELQPGRGYCTDVFFDAAKNFITSPSEKPFFCYLATNAPHGPYLVEDSYKKPYLDKGVPEPMASFYGMITNIDENLGELLGLLESRELARDTVVVFMTDNGTAAGFRAGAKKGNGSVNGSVDDKKDSWSGFNAGMRGTKGQQFDGGHRVPCFIRFPDGRLADQEIGQLTAHVDLIPTLASICDLDLTTASHLDGKDVLPLADETVEFPERTLVVQSHRVERPRKWVKSSVLTETWRLVDGEQLYSIKQDPGQQRDVAVEHPEVVSKLRQAYEAWWSDCAADPDRYSSIPLGDPNTGLVRLTAHDWHGPQPPWNQRMIESAPRTNGEWAVDIKRSGTYQFWLATRPLAEPRAVGCTEAVLQVGDIETRVDVNPDAVLIPVRIYLPAGEAMLRTQLISADAPAGKDLGAYYAYATFLTNENLPAQETQSEWLRPGDRVAWVGGTLIERAQEFGCLDSQFLSRSPTSGLSFCNLGWSGDDVRGRARAVFGNINEGKARRARDLDLAAPSVVVVAYGMSEALDQEFSVELFETELKAFVKQQRDSGRRVVLARIPDVVFDSGGDSAVGAQQLGEQSIDWEQVLAKYAARRTVLNERIVAVAENSQDSSDVSEVKVIDLPALRTSWFESALYINSSGYEAWASAFAEQALGGATQGMPESMQARLQKTAEEANRVFFEMHRPQNETYLYLFRKHEQGNNAVEPLQNRPLLAELQLELLRLSAMGNAAR